MKSKNRVMVFLALLMGSVLMSPVTTIPTIGAETYQVFDLASAHTNTSYYRVMYFFYHGLGFNVTTYESIWTWYYDYYVRYLGVDPNDDNYVLFSVDHGTDNVSAHGEIVNYGLEAGFKQVANLKNTTYRVNRYTGYSEYGVPFLMFNCVDLLTNVSRHLVNGWYVSNVPGDKPEIDAFNHTATLNYESNTTVTISVTPWFLQASDMRYLNTSYSDTESYTSYGYSWMVENHTIMNDTINGYYQTYDYFLKIVLTIENSTYSVISYNIDMGIRAVNITKYNMRYGTNYTEVAEFVPFFYRFTATISIEEYHDVFSPLRTVTVTTNDNEARPIDAVTDSGFLDLGVSSGLLAVGVSYVARKTVGSLKNKTMKKHYQQ